MTISAFKLQRNGTKIGYVVSGSPTQQFYHHLLHHYAEKPPSDMECIPQRVVCMVIAWAS